MPSRQLDFPVFDVDNHMYETRDALTKFIPERFKGVKHPTTGIVMAGIWREHADLLVPSRRPVRWAFAGLARLGRLIGYPRERPAS